MKFKNTTNFPNWFLRRLVSSCASRAGIPVKAIRSAKFRNTRRSFSGVACEDMWFVVSIGPSERFPRIGLKYPGLKNTTVYDLNDRIEALVYVTSHEIEHLADYRNRVLKTQEANVDYRAIESLEVFRVNRDTLLAEWEKPPIRCAALKAPVSKVEERKARAIENLRMWETKFKIAKTKVTKYRARVRYYERKNNEA